MFDYRDNYRKLPDVDGLDNICMTNGSSGLDYEQASEHIKKSQNHITERTIKMLVRVDWKA